MDYGYQLDELVSMKGTLDKFNTFEYSLNRLDIRLQQKCAKHNEKYYCWNKKGIDNKNLFWKKKILNFNLNIKIMLDGDDTFN
ncbi:hypothetical protein BpHYR1_006224 [Brachionus plicatilis]|uniref:Uncharacterized protein n=1 Tax=Brachionus plicatilis TaxID=10195 RepID=A0A3M7S8V0_BRAPC|nr:hypothetical protein BpHYR1_006224 [Brachionus plicatilis]